jgi:hypothetical protein
MKFFAVSINNLMQAMILTWQIMPMRNTPSLKVLECKHLLYQRRCDIQKNSPELKMKVDPVEPTYKFATKD